MRNSILYRKPIGAILAVALLAFSMQSISYSQFPRLSSGRTSTGGPKLSVDQLYDKTIRSLVWIVSESGQGSGVLIDEELRLAITNHHVTKDNASVKVFFPVRDRHGNLIDERNFYLNKSNLGVLSRLGYAATGRIIAKEPKTDLAIVQLDGLPDTAREIEHNFNYSPYLRMDANEPVQIFGNPGGLKLWKWAAGFFQTVHQGLLKIHAGTYKGNSGGPVINEQGTLIGIATLSNERTATWAVPAKHIKDLLNTLQPRQVFSIQNNTAFTVHYQTKWFEDDPWEKTSVKPGQAMNHWYPGAAKNIPKEYPKIRFDYIANDETFTPKHYKLQTYSRTLGSGVKPSRLKDAREYHFGYNSRTKILDLYDSEKKD